MRPGSPEFMSHGIASGLIDPKDAVPKETAQRFTGVVSTRDAQGNELLRQFPEGDPEILKGVPGYERPESQRSGEISPVQKLTQTRLLRNTFVRETSAAREVQRQLAQMEEGMKSAQAGDAAAGAQAVLVTFQKILDPTSVVRESEYARSGAGQSLINRIQGAYERLAQGGAGVPVAELAAFANLAREFVRRQNESAMETKEQIDRIAESFGLDPTLITREFAAPEPPSPNQPPSSPEAGVAPPAVKWEVGPDGRLRRKG
jgi:hypothetical protein